MKHISRILLDNGIKLEIVLHVPEFKFNLIISTHKLCKDLFCEVIFSHNKCLIQGPSLNHSQVLGELQSGLYVVEAKVSELALSTSYDGTTCTALREDAMLWHMRLGHMPFNKLHLINGCFANNVANDIVCYVCPKARQTRIPFPKFSSSSTAKAFDLTCGCLGAL